MYIVGSERSRRVDEEEAMASPARWRLRPVEWRTRAHRMRKVMVSAVFLSFGVSMEFGGHGYVVEVVTPWRRWDLWGVT